MSQISMFKPQKTPVMNSGKIYIGVDPGADGAIVVLQGNNILEKHTVPKMKVQSTKPSRDRNKALKKDKFGKNIYAMKDVMDEKSFCELIKGVKVRYPDAVVCLEKVKNIQSVGAVSNFNFGHNFGLLRGFLISVGYDFIESTPQNWQKHVLVSSDGVFTADGKDTKATSLNAFKRLFPNEDMRATSRSTIFHDGLVDAALIAKFAQVTDTSVIEVFNDDF